MNNLNIAINKFENIAYEFNTFLANNPEIGGQEFKAYEKILKILNELNIPTIEHLLDIPTAFLANIVSSKDETAPNIAILMEYDALENIGHACGHSASGAISLLSALSFFEHKNDINANIDLIGTPDEENDGAKVYMANNDLFKKYDLAIMIHINSNKTYPNCHFLALKEFDVEFFGAPAHASASPWKGINALNAAILTTHALDMLRQQTLPSNRIGYIIKEGGYASNIIPEYSKIKLNIRANKKSELAELYSKIETCIDGCAKATFTNYKIDHNHHVYDDMQINEAATDVMCSVLDELNVKYYSLDKLDIYGSSDIGNVSYQCPALHPMLACCDEPHSLHTHEITEIMKCSSKINPTIKLGAKIIVNTILKVINNDTLLKNIKDEFLNN